MLGQLARPDRVVVADFEAGLGTVLRLQGMPVDVVVIVVEPTAKSIEVGVRAAETVRTAELGRVLVAANRIRDDDDEARVRAAFPDAHVVLIPEDPAITAAERLGQAALDVAPDSPAVRALITLAEGLQKAG